MAKYKPSYRVKLGRVCMRMKVRPPDQHKPKPSSTPSLMSSLNASTALWEVKISPPYSESTSLPIFFWWRSRRNLFTVSSLNSHVNTGTKMGSNFIISSGRVENCSSKLSSLQHFDLRNMMGIVSNILVDIFKQWLGRDWCTRGLGKVR